MTAAWPRALREGDRVALVSPASKPDRVLLGKGIGLLESWGLVVEDLTAEPVGWRAGSDVDRRLQLQRALDDEGVCAVICTRGGFGSARIVDGMAFDRFVDRAAAFVGFSDATTLHTALNVRGLVTFHGPSLAWHPNNGDDPLDSIAAASLRSSLFDWPPETVLSDSSEATHVLSSGGLTVGPLIGGDLSTLASGAGTASQLDASSAIVFLEETEEPPPTIDRLLTQLGRSGSLDGAIGFVVGQLTACDVPGAIAVLAEHLAQFDAPILGGVSVGHGRHQRTLALGAVVEIDPHQGTLRYVDVERSRVP